MGENGEQTWVKIIVIVATFLSATLGFAAEATNLQLADVKIATDRRCTYPDHPKSPTQELGIAAIIALLVSRVYCSTRYHISSPMSRLSLISSW
ncbi:hypothetical protein OSB04_030509 [Centaurea solstitialis]|uniref:Uncharacterized protein n=1 Tax=Centaurea solstitialis TaxID=347529 RepID=A0AA38SJZ9_9ASTR|nr:hypothetical protein OSB04_030509 [Centaurea solstitialis]